MATHDYVIDNASGSAVRTDLNNVFQAILTNNSSSSAPSTTAAYMWWADTNDGVLKIRNSANNAWVTLLQLDGTLTLEDGSASTPALGFRDDLNTGIFSSAADNLDITTGGTTRVNVSSTGINVTGTVVDDGATHDGDVTFTGASANIVFDKSDNQLEFADNAKAEFGTGGDLEIYHDGTDNHIVSTNGQINIQTNSSEDSIQCIPDGQVKLFYDNALQVSTSSTGLIFADNKKANFGGESDLSIYHDGSNSYIDDSGTGDLNIRGNNIELHKHTGETYAKFIANGAVELYFDDAKKAETVTGGFTVTGVCTATSFAGDGSALTGVSGGKILQVVSVSKSDTTSISASSGSFNDISGLSASITPASSSNKVLVLFNVNAGMRSGYRGSFRLVRGSTAINIADASSSVQRMTFSSIETKNNSASEQVSSNFLDSPSSTSSVTYKVQLEAEGGTHFINRTVGDGTSSTYHNGTSNITLIEVAA
tara:strand:- start:289 stop:1731 length:1443 start_codon:yes stop_codon:yes gene_type:complete